MDKAVPTLPIPEAPRALPLLGHIVPLVRDPLRFVSSLPRYGDLVRVRLGPVSAVIVCDPLLTRDVLVDTRTFDKGGPFYRRVREGIGGGLLTCPHAAHQRQRRLIQPVFHPDRLPGYAAAITARTDAMTRGWRDGQEVDVVAGMTGLTAGSLATAMFSGMLSPVEQRHIIEDTLTFAAGVYRRMLMPDWLARLPVLGNRRYAQACARLRRTFAEGTARYARDSGEEASGSLASAVLDAYAQAGPPGDGTDAESEITDNLMTLFLGGVAISAATLAWALHLLDQNPEVAARLHREVDTVLDGRPAAHADLPRLELTGRVISETLRVWSPSWMMMRHVTRDTELGGHHLPRGTSVIYSSYLLHRRGDLFPRPDRFDPDRWLSEPPRHAYIPFGGGARKCIGYGYGLNDTILALATITSRWHLASPAGQKITPSLGGELHPRGLTMRAGARSVPIAPPGPGGTDSPIGGSV
ncbi:cytochrome P450 [Streptomyces sp. NPDC059247]|uniref:cytochrome P450 n=1 Tax=Streptomyces sp. NPDC059247 TaxID=3346790 RepID=UPI0036CC552F